MITSKSKSWSFTSWRQKIFFIFFIFCLHLLLEDTCAHTHSHTNTHIQFLCVCVYIWTLHLLLYPPHNSSKMMIAMITIGRLFKKKIFLFICSSLFLCLSLFLSIFLCLILLFFVPVLYLFNHFHLNESIQSLERHAAIKL